jgi:DnaJ-class molecular chaperone
MYRVTVCPDCDGEGEHKVITHISHEDGCPDGYREVCPTCDGKGAVFVELATISMYDLPPPRDQ